MIWWLLGSCVAYHASDDRRFLFFVLCLLTGPALLAEQLGALLRFTLKECGLDV